MSTVGDLRHRQRRLPTVFPRAHACSAPVHAAAVAQPLGRAGAARHHRSTLLALGGVDAVVAAGVIGGDAAGDEDSGRPVSWPGRASGGPSTRTSGATGRRGSQRFGNIRIFFGNTPTPEYEYVAMHEDSSLRAMRGDAPGRWRDVSRVPDGYQGRAGAAAVVAGSVSTERPVRSCGTGRDGEPALGVMGGPLQPVSSPAEPPVSSLSGPAKGLTMTAPAPRNVQAGDVSPQADAAHAAVDVEPTLSQTGPGVLPDDPFWRS